MSLHVLGAVLGIDEKPWVMFEGTPNERSGTAYTAHIGSGGDVESVKCTEAQAVELAKHGDDGVPVDVTVAPQLREMSGNLLAPFKLQLRVVDITTPGATASPVALAG